MTDNTDALRQLLSDWEKPPADMVGQLPRGGTKLDYMGHASVTKVLIEVDPLWNWEPAAVNEDGSPVISRSGSRAIMWAKLTVLGVTRWAVGTCDSGKGDPEKELIGDMLRNGAMRFGIGLSLWSKEEWAEGSQSFVKAPASKAAKKAPSHRINTNDLAGPEHIKATTKGKVKAVIELSKSDGTFDALVASIDAASIPRDLTKMTEEQGQQVLAMSEAGRP